MARLVLVALALLAAGGLAEPGKKVLPQKIADQGFLQKQVQLWYLFFHVHEPTFVQEQKTIVDAWDIEKNIESYSNVTAVKIYGQLFENGLLPRAVPFTILLPEHRFEAVTLFNVLYSAKDYTIFYKTAAYLREHINEGIFVYVLTAAILHREDTQGIVVPPIYEIFPSYFYNGEIVTSAQRINTHGKTSANRDNIVIRWNETVWPYFNYDNVVSYYTHDHELNTYYYNYHLAYPFWLGGESCPLVKDRRGEWWWFMHKQIVTRYYMERLSNGLGEIPELGLDVVQEGYCSGLIYHNGIPYPVRPNHYHLDQPQLIDELTHINDYERRIRDAIERGYVVNVQGEHININKPEAIDILGNLIEANVDSLNNHYYRDFITLWKGVLGGSVVHEHVVHRNNQPLVLPSVLGHFQTSLRDPAFWMIWKRVLRLFTLWQEQLPPYKPEELALPSVQIKKVEVDKLVTYFDLSHVNITNHLHLDEQERHNLYNDVSVLVERPQLNHKVFQVRVNVKSDVASTVVVRFFLAPKYDSHGYEIPLHRNTENFFLLDQFTHKLPQGESTIKRDSTENVYTINHWPTGWETLSEAQNALHGKGQYVLDQTHKWTGYPQRLMLPKGRIGGMPYVFVAYISEYRAPKVPYGTGFDSAVSLGVGSGAIRITDDPLGYPFNRPLHWWQVEDLRNFHVQDVSIYHKDIPEINVPFTE